MSSIYALDGKMLLLGENLAVAAFRLLGRGWISHTAELGAVLLKK